MLELVPFATRREALPGPDNLTRDRESGVFQGVLELPLQGCRMTDVKRRRGFHQAPVVTR
jgi:hypothetical protein